MPLLSAYSTTPFDLAKRLLTEAESSGQDLTFLPFNGYDAEETHTCWLSPSRENPAYWRGKVVYTNQATTPDTFVGYYVEKGIGPSGPGALSAGQQKMVMNDQWLWAQVADSEVDHADFDRLAGLVADSSGVPVHLTVDCWPLGLLKMDDFLEYSYDGKSMTLISPPQSELTKLPALTRPADIFRATSQLPNADWLWLDLMIGFRCKSSDADGAWDPEAIWTQTAAPWASWLR
jgi:hypothetical protein